MIVKPSPRPPVVLILIETVKGKGSLCAQKEGINFIYMQCALRGLHTPI